MEFYDYKDDMIDALKEIFSDELIEILLDDFISIEHEFDRLVSGKTLNEENYDTVFEKWASDLDYEFRDRLEEINERETSERNDYVACACER